MQQSSVKRDSVAYILKRRISTQQLTLHLKEPETEQNKSKAESSQKEGNNKD